LGELDRRGGWAEDGTGSCAESIAWRCGLTPRAAREHVRVARRLPELPKNSIWAKGRGSAEPRPDRLCRRHHRAVHEGGYTVDHDGRFYYPWGREVAPVPRHGLIAIEGRAASIRGDPV
jgi:hypothetical protein